MGYLSIGMGVAIAILTTLLWNAETKLTKANVSIGTLQSEVDIAVHANKTVRTTLEVCKAINSSNAQARDSVMHKAELAEGRVRVLAQILEDEINEIEINDETCRTLSDPLPAVFADSLCIDDANCG